MIEVNPADEPETCEYLATAFITDIKTYIDRRHPGQLRGYPGYRKSKDKHYLTTTDQDALRAEEALENWSTICKYLGEYCRQRAPYVPYKGHTYHVKFREHGDGGVGVVVFGNIRVVVFRVTEEDMAAVLNERAQSPFRRLLKGLFGT
jgi:hypothetical protein